MGDLVRWSWATPFFVTEPVFTVIQTDSLNGNETDKGFRRQGSAASNGMLLDANFHSSCTSN